MTIGDRDEKAVVNLSPKAMVDSVAEWPLHRVVDHLRRKEQESGVAPEESRISYRSNIRMLTSAVSDAAKSYGVSQSKLCRWLSFHAISMAKDDTMLTDMVAKYAQLTRVGLEAADADVLDILNAIVPYSPKNVAEHAGMLHLYAPWIRSEFQELAVVCGVYAYRIVQVFIMRSIMTGDHEDMVNLMREFTIESERWDKWMRMRLGAIEGMLDKSPFEV